MAAPANKRAEPVGASISSFTSTTRYTSPICILNQMLVGLLTRKLVNWSIIKAFELSSRTLFIINQQMFPLIF